MAFVTCLGCNNNCDLPTDDDNIFCDNGSTYEASCYCPYSRFWVEFDEEDLQKAWNDDNGIGDDE